MLAIIIVSVATILIVLIPSSQKPKPRELVLQNDNIADIGGHFILSDQNKQKFDSDSLKGSYSLIYFGFTYCPDICPASLQNLSQVITALDQYKISLTPVFITLDPNRDTPEVLSEYLPHFHQKWIGLTGTPEEIKQVAEKFKVYYTIREVRPKNNTTTTNNDSVNSYLIDHSSFTYLLDKNNRYIQHFAITTSPEEIIEAIRVNNNN